MTFTELGLHEEILEGLSSLGFTNPTPIQEESIPIIKKGKDLIGCAQTGTGKTAAFLLPIMDMILRQGNHSGTQCLIIVPTRELAIQIDQQLQGLAYFTAISSIAIYGGSGGDVFSQEKKALTEGASIIIATPGRFSAHQAMNYVDLSNLKFLVLDEADRMLDMGFYHDIMKIISFTPESRQSLLFSATMPPKIRDLSKEVLKEPEEVNIAISVPPDKIIQLAFSVYDPQKIPLIEYLLTKKDFNSVIIFCSTKESTKSLSSSLKKASLSVAEIHSDLEQSQREEVMNLFRARKVKVLVATDIVSRGIDIEDIEMVINFDVPNEGEDYVHRIGRTARASSKGVAFTLINENDQVKFSEIESLLDKVIPKAKAPNTLGPTPEYDPDKFKKIGRKKSGKRKPFRKSVRKKS